MDAPEAEARYRSLREQKDAGIITADDYRRETDLLRYRDAGGTWRAINPVTGGWLWWDGTAWKADDPGNTPAVSAAGSPGSGAAAPATSDPGRVTPPSGAGPGPAAPARQGRDIPAILSTGAGIVSWFLFPLVFGLLGIAAGVWSLARSKTRHRRVSYLALAGIVLAVLSLVASSFFFNAFLPGMLPP